MTGRCDETQSEFEARYNESHRARSASVDVRPRFSHVDPFDWFEDRKVSMPCTCDDGGGPTHWAAIINTPEGIQDHLDHEQLLESLNGANA